MAATPVRPASADELCECIEDAARSGARLVLLGGGSKRAIGRPTPEAVVVDMRGFAGVIDYDPSELVLTVGAGTPLAEVEALVAARDQMLAFEPFDHGPLFGEPAGAATIGGVIAAGVAGSQRLTQGGARDHLLGFRAVSGRGEVFVGGAKVVKNVTGYDLPKLMAGSWGRLAALTEVTLKVMPRPRVVATRVITGLSTDEAVAVMASAMGSQAEIAAAAYLPAELGGGVSMTAFRIQGFGPSVAARCSMLAARLTGCEALDETEATALWTSLQTLEPLGLELPLWRVNVPPREACAVVAALRPLGGKWLLDWAGGLIWAACDGGPEVIRAAALTAGRHATLVRAPEALRRVVPALQPQVRGIEALEARVRRAFDPHEVFEAGRF